MYTIRLRHSIRTSYVLRNDIIMCTGNSGDNICFFMVKLQNCKQDRTAGVTPQDCALHNCWHQSCSTAALMSMVQTLRSSEHVIAYPDNCWGSRTNITSGLASIVLGPAQ